MPPVPPSTHRRRARTAAALAAAVAAVTVLFGASPAEAAPMFKAPFPCGQRWTYSHHSGEVRQALDFVRADGGVTNGTPVLASAAGTARRYSQPGGAGNYVAVEHGGGWKTYYFHLSAYSVPDGAAVAQGQQIGVTGSTGNTSGPHIHYEQLLNGVGQSIVINGASLAPYPGSYSQRFLTSDNCGAAPGRYWVDTFADAPVYATATSTAVTGTLRRGTNYVFCKVWGRQISGANGTFNHWWLRTDPDVGPGNQYVSAYYLSRWGNDEARDNGGVVIRDC